MNGSNKLECLLLADFSSFSIQINVCIKGRSLLERRSTVGSSPYWAYKPARSKQSSLLSSYVSHKKFKCFWYRLNVLFLTTFFIFIFALYKVCKNLLKWGAQYLTWENLKDVWVEFSTLSWAVLLYNTKHWQHANGNSLSWKLGPGIVLYAEFCPWLNSSTFLGFYTQKGCHDTQHNDIQHNDT